MRNHGKGKLFQKGISGNPGGRPKKLPAEFFSYFEAGDPANGLPPRNDRIRALLLCDDLQVRLRVEQIILEHQFGKPAQAVDVTSDGERITTLIEPARPQTREEWLAAYADSQQTIAQLDQGITDKAPN